MRERKNCPACEGEGVAWDAPDDAVKVLCPACLGADPLEPPYPDCSMCCGDRWVVLCRECYGAGRVAA